MAKINKKTDKSNFFLSFLFYKYIILNQRMRNEHTRNTWRTVCNYVANIPQNANEQSVKCQRTPTKCATNTPLGVGVDSSCPYPCVNKNVYFHNQIRIPILLNMCFYIIKYVYSFHHTHISVRHFVGVFIYAGAINRPLRLLTACQNIADGLPKHC